MPNLSDLLYFGPKHEGSMWLQFSYMHACTCMDDGHVCKKDVYIEYIALCALSHKCIEHQLTSALSTNAQVHWSLFPCCCKNKTMLKTISLHSAPTQIALYTCGCWKMASFDDAIIAPRSAQRMETFLSTEARNCHEECLIPVVVVMEIMHIYIYNIYIYL